MQKVKDILEEIYTNDIDFVVCSDTVLTSNIEKEIRNYNWDDKNRLNEQGISNDTKNMVLCFKKDKRLLQKNKNIDKYMENLSYYQNISNHVPQKTKFKVIKKIIVKLMQVCVRYQEEFNYRLVSLLGIYNDEISILKTSILEKDRIIESMNKTMIDNMNRMIVMEERIKMLEKGGKYSNKD